MLLLHVERIYEQLMLFELCFLRKPPVARISRFPLVLVLPLMFMLYALLIPILFLAMQTVHAQPQANPDDVATIDAIIDASYEVISGEAGEPRDWDRERSLFYPGARHMPTTTDSTGIHSAQILDVEGFIERVTPFFEQQSFFEYEIARKVDRFGNIAQVFSTYAWSREKGGPVGGRGINSFQLMYDGKRWWIMSILWQQESDDHPIPAAYRP